MSIFRPSRHKVEEPSPVTVLNPTPDDVNKDVLVQKTVPGFKLVVTEVAEEGKLDGSASATLLSLTPRASGSDLLQVPPRKDRRRKAQNRTKIEPRDLGEVVPEKRQGIIVIPELVEFPRVVEDSVANVPEAPSTPLAEQAVLLSEAEAYPQRGRRTS